MAELLVKAIDATHSDPEKDARGCYKRGDVVVAFDDGHEWGRLEVLPPDKGGKFVIVKLPGVTLEQLHAETSKRIAAGLLDAPTDKDGKAVGRRAAKIDLDALTANDREASEKQGRVTLTKLEAANLVVEKPQPAEEVVK